MKKAGFSLLELMIALTLSSLVVASVLSLILGQANAVDGMRDRATQLEQVRAVTDFMSAEIVDLPRGAVVYARKDSIAFRLPLSWGSVCGDLERVVKTKDKTVDTSVPNISSGIFLEPLPTALGAPTPEGFGVAADGVNWTWFNVASWSSLSLVPSQTARQACLALDSTVVETADSLEADRFHIFADLEAYLGMIPPTGMVIAPFMYVSYFFTSDKDGLVLNRGTASGVQKLAWPFHNSAGFRFRLVDGSEATTVEGASLTDIRYIKLNLPAVRKKKRTLELNSLEAAPWIPLFNSR